MKTLITLFLLLAGCSTHYLSVSSDVPFTVWNGNGTFERYNPGVSTLKEYEFEMTDHWETITIRLSDNGFVYCKYMRVDWTGRYMVSDTTLTKAGQTVRFNTRTE